MSSLDYYSFQPVAQSNHDSYFIPPELIELKGQPLYVLIAHWGFLRKSSFYREDLAAAFGITERRAADLMRYLHKKQSLALSCLESVAVNTTFRRGRKLSMQVFQIYPDCSEHNMTTVRQTSKRKSKKTISQEYLVGGMALWNQLISQH